MDRRRFGCGIAIAACLGLLACAEAHSQLVDQPVRIIYPFAAGGGGDAMARLLADRLAAGLGRPVVVESRTGAGGRIGVMAVKSAPPDGSTLLFTPIAPISIYPLVFPQLSYDPFIDFEPVSQIGTNEFCIAINPAIPAKTLPELVTWLKANPTQANFGVPAMGTLPHFLGVMFGRAAEIDMRPIAFRGAAASIADAVAGHVPMVVSGTNDLSALHANGRLRVLATSNAERSRFIADVPTFRELGYDLVATGWYSLYAPAKTPPEAIARLSRIVMDAVQTPEVRGKLESYGQNPTGTSPQQLATIQKADMEHWAPIIKATGFKAE